LWIDLRSATDGRRSGESIAPASTAGASGGLGPEQSCQRIRSREGFVCEIARDRHLGMCGILPAFLHQDSAKKEVRRLHLVSIAGNVCCESDALAKSAFGLCRTASGEVHLPEKEPGVTDLGV
jgi:hypothetical protein